MYCALWATVPHPVWNKAYNNELLLLKTMMKNTTRVCLWFEKNNKDISEGNHSMLGIENQSKIRLQFVSSFILHFSSLDQLFTVPKHVCDCNGAVHLSSLRLVRRLHFDSPAVDSVKGLPKYLQFHNLQRTVLWSLQEGGKTSLRWSYKMEFDMFRCN